MVEGWGELGLSLARNNSVSEEDAPTLPTRAGVPGGRASGEDRYGVKGSGSGKIIGMGRNKG